ncbi:hypothetical protein HRbin16_01463 [bacterium HR16]|nr:hypothetical protein HRbin16_01463 [bacterium HR16]
MSLSKPMNDARFFGPFSSWLDVKRDFGAIGDGKSDDTDAIQRALDAIRPPDSKAAVLYLPAGTYRITRPLQVVRGSHSESQHICILGEHPEKVRIIWDGSRDGVMINYDAWYARMGRITLDGRNKAKTAILCAPHFVTYNEFTDMVFKDVGFGIEAGRMDTQGVAETVVARCRFLRCNQAGISIQNFNSLDWFIWHCLFEGCRLGVTNAFGAGNFHVYESIFRRSSSADMSMGHAGYFSIRHNFSQGSRAFFVAGWLSACGNITIQGNTIVDPQSVAIEIYNNGPLLLLDNVFLVRKAPAVKVRPDAGFLSAGNVFTVKDAVEAKPSAFRMDDKVVPYASVKATPPQPPYIPPTEKRKVIEVRAGASAQEIQNAINQAARSERERPVLHLPAGTYVIDRPLVVPPQSNVCIVGDGGKTVLRWRGEGTGPILLFKGPAHVVISDLMLDGAGRADGLVVQNVDQRGARFLADQLNVSGAQQAGILVNRLRNTQVHFFNLNHAECKVGVKVAGVEHVVIFSGASSNNELSYEVTDGANLLVRDIWYESGTQPRFIVFSDAGNFTMHGARIACASKSEKPPVVEIQDFRGKIAFLTTDFTNWSDNRKVHVKREAKGVQVLLLGAGIDGEGDVQNDSPDAEMVMLESSRVLPGGGWTSVPDVGKPSPQFMKEMLALTRQTQPQPVDPVGVYTTDVRIHRVLIGNVRYGLWLK